MDIKKAKELAKEYYECIVYYEKNIKKQIVIDENIPEFQKKLITTIHEVFDLQREPWNNLTKGKEIEELTNIFSSNIEITKRYLVVEDYIRDEFYESGTRDLKRYYEDFKINSNNEDDEIWDTLDEYCDNKEIDEDKVSSDTIKLFNLLMMIEPVTKKIYKEIHV